MARVRHLRLFLFKILSIHPHLSPSSHVPPSFLLVPCISLSLCRLPFHFVFRRDADFRPLMKGEKKEKEEEEKNTRDRSVPDGSDNNVLLVTPAESYPRLNKTLKTSNESFPPT